MASEVGEEAGVVDGTDLTYKDALLDGEPQQPQSDFHPDPSILNTSHQHPKKEGEDGDKDGVQNLKTSLLISGGVIAVIGAIIVLVKKIKET